MDDVPVNYQASRDPLYYYYESCYRNRIYLLPYLSYVGHPLMNAVGQHHSRILSYDLHTAGITHHHCPTNIAELAGHHLIV